MRTTQSLVLMIMILAACCKHESPGTLHDHQSGLSSVSVKQARGFSIEDNDSYPLYLLSVRQ
jgi:hypothetical protein